jgi:hypothetical protein
MREWHLALPMFAGAAQLLATGSCHVEQMTTAASLRIPHRIPYQGRLLEGEVRQKLP